jgi:glycosyltransferase involved in cell wall biosynthesis
MISIIIPFYNEKESLPKLVGLLEKELKGKESEIVLVDDGSTDALRQNFQNPISKIQVIRHRKRMGKGQALKTGIDNAQGNVIVFMDADLQDDPKDLSKFFKKIDEGYDFINGIRQERRDNFLVKIYSALAAFFLKTFLRSPYTDINCGFKAFKREVLSGFSFYGNNFRFFPLAVSYAGYKVGEIPVTNNPRRHGVSKFGPGKLIVGVFDTMTAYFLYRFSERPLHFFGTIGGVAFLAGFSICFYLTIERLFFNVLLITRPVLWLGLLLIIVGVQIIMTGIIGELIVYLNKRKN